MWKNSLLEFLSFPRDTNIQFVHHLHLSSSRNSWRPHHFRLCLWSRRIVTFGLRWFVVPFGHDDKEKKESEGERCSLDQISARSRDLARFREVRWHRVVTQSYNEWTAELAAVVYHVFVSFPSDITMLQVDELGCVCLMHVETARRGHMTSWDLTRSRGRTSIGLWIYFCIDTCRVPSRSLSRFVASAVYSPFIPPTTRHARQTTQRYVPLSASGPRIFSMPAQIRTQATGLHRRKPEALRNRARTVRTKVTRYTCWRLWLWRRASAPTASPRPRFLRRRKWGVRLRNGWRKRRPTLTCYLEKITTR